MLDTAQNIYFSLSDKYHPMYTVIADVNPYVAVLNRCRYCIVTSPIGSQT